MISPPVSAMPTRIFPRPKCFSATSRERTAHQLSAAQPERIGMDDSPRRTQRGTATTEDSEYLPQRRKGRKENSYSNLALFAPWREESPSLRFFLWS